YEKFYHRLDPKLQVKHNLVEANPKLGNLLERLRKATGLTMTLADNLTYHEPEMGVMQMPNASSWSLMELIALMDIDNGRWEKTDTGYRLTGQSKALRPPPRPSHWLLAAC